MLQVAGLYRKESLKYQTLATGDAFASGFIVRRAGTGCHDAFVGRASSDMFSAR